MTDFVEWKPERFGHKPPYWQDRMDWGLSPDRPKAQSGVPMWFTDIIYIVPREAVYGPIEEVLSVPDYAANGVIPIDKIVAQLRKWQPEALARHGITLAPEKDWATELWADLLEARGHEDGAWFVRNGEFGECEKDAIELLHSRVTPKEASNA